MKSIIFLFDLTVYSVQIISLALTFITFLKNRNRTFKFYIIVLLVTLLDNIANSVRDFLVITVVPEKIVFILISYFNSILLMLWFLYSAFLVHGLTNEKISTRRLIFIITVSVYPVFYVVTDVLFYGILKFQPSEEPFSFCVITTQLLNIFCVFIFLYSSMVLLQNRKKIADKNTRFIATTGMVFSMLFIPAFIIDLSHVLNGFNIYFVLLLAWNIMNMAYQWRHVYSRQVKQETKEAGSGSNNQADIAQQLINGIISVKNDESYLFLKFEDIITARAVNKRTVLKTVGSSYVTDYTLAELEEKSCGKLIRVHRNSLINPGRIRQVEKYFSGTYAAVMENSDIVEMSRRVSSSFRKTYLQ